MRGEYLWLAERLAQHSELPPRARRIQICWFARGHQARTTSACAENTLRSPPKGANAGNYLRVRGEYATLYLAVVTKMELPPRARRILARRTLVLIRAGTTSACAENTPQMRHTARHCGNYLRVRGEYAQLRWGFCGRMELPPRARRIPKPHLIQQRIRGTTSACAENTTLRRWP